MISIKNIYKLSAAFVFLMLIMLASFSVGASANHSKPPAEISSVKPIPTRVLGVSISTDDYTSPANTQPIDVNPGVAPTTSVPRCLAVPADDTSYSLGICGSSSRGTPGTNRPYTDVAPVDHELFPVDPGPVQSLGAIHCSAMPTRDSSYLRNLCPGT